MEASARSRRLELGPALIDQDLLLRLARRDEQARLFAWHEAAFRAHIEAIHGWDGHWQRDDFARLLRHVPTFVVMHRQGDIGYLQCLVRADSLHLVNIALIREARGQGVGRQLLIWLTRRAASAQLLVTLGVYVTNARARRFYAALGFTLTQTTASHWRMIWRPDTPPAGD